MAEIYYKQRKTRAKEANFFEVLCKNLGIDEDEPSGNRYYFPSDIINKTINKLEVIKWVYENKHLTTKKKSDVIGALADCPEEIQVVRSIKRITANIAVVIKSTTEPENKEVYYIDFHEKQHHKLTISRDSKVYTVDGVPIIVPRFVQRLLRDIWKAKYVPNYTIVWSDWSKDERNNDKPEDLHSGFNEFAFYDQFTFKSIAS